MRKVIYAFMCMLLLNTLPLITMAQPANDLCTSATPLPVNNNCAPTAGDFFQATQTNPTASCSGNRYDVWYRFTVPANSSQVTISLTRTSANPGFGATDANIEVFNVNACGASLNNNSRGGCGNTNGSRTFGGLTPSATYLFRVGIMTNPNVDATRWGFNICVTSNDNCATATTLSGGVPMTGNVLGASASAGVPVGCATGTPDDDVWYTFTSQDVYANINLVNIGTSLNTSGLRYQVFSGACGTLASVACGTGSGLVTGLTRNAPYFIRVYSAGAGQTGFSHDGSLFTIQVTPTTVGSGRMAEVFRQTVISGPGVLADPWEITYDRKDSLWITESKGYRVYRMSPTSGARDEVLNISQGSTFFTAPADQAFNAQFNINTNGAQGGLAGLVLHPDFLDPIAPKNFVYISYVWKFVSDLTPSGKLFTNTIVRFTYNPVSKRLESPIAICDTLPGSNDHNSQRMIIAPVGATDYLFYAAGDMGSGQFANRDRAMKAQNITAYEGKILRFNLEPDGDGGAYTQWIPNDNPYSATNAVWSIGIRNNQGFAYDSVNNNIYGSSHGPYSDDEINIIQPAKNYGHPLVIGYAADDNYNGITAGAAKPDNSGVSTCPVIVDESDNALTTIGASYKDPLFSAYAPTNAYLTTLWNAASTPNNGGWPSEGWSGMDWYNHTLIPGWKNSLLMASLKWGRVLRLKLNGTSTAVIPTNGSDTISYFGSTNRFRDMALAPGGRDIYVIMDRSATTSGPSAGSPVIPACGGCVQRYTFLGYNDNGFNRSTIPTAIPVDAGTANACVTGTPVTIDVTNNNLWVPITGPNGNIVAEIKANGNNLGLVQSSFFVKSGTHRSDVAGRLYLNRNITINPAVQPAAGTPVDVRLYITKAELDALAGTAGSGVTTSISSLSVFKNNDPCLANISRGAPKITTTYQEAHGANAFVLAASVSSFSTFYFGSNGFTILPAELISFEGKWSNSVAQLNWLTASNEKATGYTVERSQRSGDGFVAVGYVAAKQITGTKVNYDFADADAINQPGSDIFYRLKLHASDGSFAYSKIVQLSKPAPSMQLYPNPVEDVLKINLGTVAVQGMTVQITDAQGRVVHRQAVRAGRSLLEVNMKGWAAQLYAVTVLNAAGEVVVSKTVLKK